MFEVAFPVQSNRRIDARMKLSSRWSAVTIVALVLVLGYLFVPIAKIRLPPQDQFMDDPDILLATQAVAAQWNVSEERLGVLAYKLGNYGDKALAIIDPDTSSSASLLIASPEAQAGQPTSGLELSERLHIASEHIPQGGWEKAIARNFYTKGRWAQTHKAVIVDLDGGIPLGEIRANSLVMGELRIPTLFSYPLFFLAVHIDTY